MKNSTEKIILIIIIIFIILSRLIFLNIRPLHHDEGVNYFFAKQIMDTGTFKYDALNYHGPLYFFALWLSFIIFGVSEFSLRLPAAIFGIVLIITILFIRSKQNYNKYILSLFLLISPSILFYSRYSIHESAFILFSFLSIYSFTRILETKNLNNLPLFASSLALLITTKETGIIILLILFILSIINFKEIKKIKPKENVNIIILSITFFLLIYMILFTSFFTNLNGLVDSVKSYLPWTERGFTEQGHQKPFNYYLLLILQYEFPLFILALLGLFYACKNRKNIFLRNISIWFILTFIIYSLINYKTPWLIINITLPMTILAASGLNLIKKTKLKIILILITIIYLAFFSIYFNFIHPWQSDNPFAYVHTDPDVLNLIKELNQNYKQNSSILIASDTYWPLPFYLDGKNVEYLENIESVDYKDYTQYDFFILKEEVFTKSTFPNEFKSEKYLLRDGVNLYLLYE